MAPTRAPSSNKPRGLDPAEAARRLAEVGRNELPPPPRRGLGRIAAQRGALRRPCVHDLRYLIRCPVHARGVEGKAVMDDLIHLDQRIIRQFGPDQRIFRQGAPSLHGDLRVGPDQVHRRTVQGLPGRGDRGVRRAEQAQGAALDLRPGDAGRAGVLADREDISFLAGLVPVCSSRFSDAA